MTVLSEQRTQTVRRGKGENAVKRPVETEQRSYERLHKE